MEWKNLLKPRVILCLVVFLPLYFASMCVGLVCEWLDPRLRRFERFCERDLPVWAHKKGKKASA